jgi:hypothetical protein
MKHWKYDLYTDEQLSAITTRIDDILTLDVPSFGTAKERKTVRGRHRVLAIEQDDAGEYEGKHYTRVSLELEGPLTE